MKARTAAIAAALLLAGCTRDPSPAAHQRAPLLATLAAEKVDAAPPSPAEPAPPVAKRIPHPTTIHGHTFQDDYFWLREKGAPDVVAYLEAENAYTAAMTAPLKPLEDALYAEMLGRIQETDASAPVRLGKWLYYARTEAGKQYRIECRKRADIADAPEQVIVDANAIAAREPFVALGPRAISDDGDLYAYGLDTTGFRQFTLHVIDLRPGHEGRELPDRIERVDALAFARDGKTLLYVTEDPVTKRANQVHRHVLGDDPAKDALVYDERDARFYVDLGRSRDGAHVVVVSSSATTSEVRLLSARDPKAAPRVVAPREAGVEYYVEPAGDRMYVRTNAGGRNFRLMTAKLGAPRAAWTELVPHRPDVMIEDVEAFADHVVVRERKDARVTYRAIDAKTGASRPLAIDEPVYEVEERDPVEPWPNVDFASHVYRMTYSAPATPRTVVDVDVVTGARTVVKREAVPNFDPARYAVERTSATARDGTQVPISIVHRAGDRPDGTHPMLLTGYGAYGIPNDVGFDRSALSLVDRGVVYAVAHVRGGGDLGKPWHDAGRMQNKMHTFTDFIDCAEGLVKSGWARRDAIAIEGASAGGLLMGAVTNMRPDLWRAVLARVPFVDVINTMADESLPLTSNELEEWGDPKIEAQLEWLMAYSPYDNVAPKRYPAMLVETSYNDSQVMYFEPAKWVARLRATKLGDAPLLLRTNMRPAGHHGVSGRYDHLRERAFDDAWLLAQLGIAGSRR